MDKSLLRQLLIIGAVLAAAFYVVLVIVSSGSENNAVPETPTVVTPAIPPTPTLEASPTYDPPAPHPVVEDPEPAEPDPEPVDSRNDYGLTEDDIVQLGQMADLYGYGFGAGTAMTFEQAENMSVAMTVPCEAVDSGEQTWQDRVAEDVGDGAPVEDAEGFNSYLENEFCPLLTEAAYENLR